MPTEAARKSVVRPITYSLSALALVFFLASAPVSASPISETDWRAEGGETMRLTARFFRRLHDFLGDLRGDYMQPGGTAYDQVGEGLSGPPDDILRLRDGGFLISGCRRHSCDEKAAVVLSRSGAIEAVGLIHFSCNGRTCADTPRLTIFLPRRSGPDRYRAALGLWAAKVEGHAISSEIVWVRRRR